MTVFKAFFRVSRRFLSPILLYTLLMCMMAVLMIRALSDRPDGMNYTTEDFALAIINQDGDDPVSRELSAFLSERARVKPLSGQDKDIRDALFWRDVDYVLVIPEGFGQAALTDSPLEITSYASPNDYTHMYADMQANRFLSTLRLYRAQLPEETMAQSVQRVLSDLRAETAVSQVQKENGSVRMLMMASYLRYMSYVLLAAISAGMGLVLLSVMHRRTLYRRRAGSLSETRYSLQLLLASLTYSSLIWLLLIGLGLGITGIGFSAFQDRRFPYLLLSSYAYTLFAMAFTLFVTAFTQQREAITGASNVVALGSSFLSGVFVPRELLGEGVIRIARLFPAYWYVDAVSGVAEAPALNPEIFAGYWRSMGILALMILAIVCVTLLANSYKRQRAI